MARCLAPAAPIADLAVDDFHAIGSDRDLICTGLSFDPFLVVPGPSVWLSARRPLIAGWP